MELTRPSLSFGTSSIASTTKKPSVLRTFLSLLSLSLSLLSLSLSLLSLSLSLLSLSLSHARALSRRD